MRKARELKLSSGFLLMRHDHLIVDNIFGKVCTGSGHIQALKDNKSFVEDLVINYTTELMGRPKSASSQTSLHTNLLIFFFLLLGLGISLFTESEIISINW